MMSRKNIILALAAVAIVGAIFYLQSMKSTPAATGPGVVAVPTDELPTVASSDLPFSLPASSSPLGLPPDAAAQPRVKPKPKTGYPQAKEIALPGGFINTAPIKIGQFIGKKVILVDFWTYSCINCQRTLPYITAWWDKYKDKGLEIISIHSPEFEFEKKYDNVVAAAKKFGIEYPIVLDNDMGTWNAYGNQYWPRKYLIDIDGSIVYDHIGEGGYNETEAKIQELLKERMTRLGIAGDAGSGIVAPKNVVSVDNSQLGSPETYFGAARNRSLGNGTPGSVGQKTFVRPEQGSPDRLYLVGDWDMRWEFARAAAAGAGVLYNYQAKNIYLVARADKPVRVKVLIDGKAPGVRAGADVKDGVMTIQEDRLYKVIEDSAYGQHTLELIIEEAGLDAYTFTFG